jgi:type IV secretion system protein VirB10
MNIEPSSPDLLGSAPGRGQGVRRLNRIPLLIAMAILAIIMAAIAYTYHLRLQASRQSGETGRKPETAIGVLTGAPDAGYIPPAVPELAPPPPPPQPQLQASPIELEKPDPHRLAWEAYYRRLEQLRMAREQAALQAVESPTKLSGEIAHRDLTAVSNPPPLSASEQFARAAAARLGRLDELAERDRDLNRQGDKRDFAAERDPKSRDENTLKAGREMPQSPYEVKAGTIIPAVMIGGANSDLPGQLLGQVAENICDTATGKFIVIPQGSKLVGTYDSGVTTGQERVLVGWTRIIFPDASSLDLGRMPGADEGGYAGLHDQVDDHFLKVWGNAILLSAFSAGIQLSQGNGNNQTGGLNATQTIAASTGQQLGQLGQEIVRRNLQIQPTLEIRPGYRFTVTVTKDLILKPWIPKKTAGGVPRSEGEE